ncbi:MAG: helix-hairpin-helix domain-containing protein [Chloroflexi bacterium]|nr:helix-hairpin-helix domain-containing protein [Chloroflexota bacterium]MCY4246413.1 helix-hairpin-helix domain-containing protein [Chloroflexota bacterium]
MRRNEMDASLWSRLAAQAKVLLFLALLSLAALAGALLWGSRPAPVVITIIPPPPTDTPMPTSTPGPLQVYVTGEVVNPQQTYALPAGSRVNDAIEAAGGPTDRADLSRINLAGFLRDGDQIHLPAVNEDESALPTPMGGAKVRINSATQAELEALPGIGPVTATRIINYREIEGTFVDLDALDAVSGIGPATLETLRDLVVFD